MVMLYESPEDVEEIVWKQLKELAVTYRIKIKVDVETSPGNKSTFICDRLPKKLEIPPTREPLVLKHGFETVTFLIGCQTGS